MRRAKKTVVHHPPYRFRSKFERDTALSLKREGVKFEYETLKISYNKPSTYTPDFIFPNGVIIEAKGFFKPSDRTKHLLIQAQDKENQYDIRFLFQNAYNRLNKNSNTTYADWCDKYGFMWCHKKIPNEWATVQL